MVTNVLLRRTLGLLLVMVGFGGLSIGNAASVAGPRKLADNTYGVVVSPDNSRAVYTTGGGPDAPFELFSIPLVGGTAVSLNRSIAAPTPIDIDNVRISSNSQRVVYLAEQSDTCCSAQLYSVPLAGGTPVRLNAPLNQMNWETIGQFIISSDSTRVIYITEYTTDPTSYYKIRNVYTTPIDGSAPAVLLNSPLQGNERVSEVVITPDSRYVVYRLTQGSGTSETSTLVSVPIAGGTPVKLDGPFESVALNDFQITADSTTLLYRRKQQATGAIALMRVAIPDGTPVKMNIPAELSVLKFMLAADDRHVVFTAIAPGAYAELYSIALANGATPVRVNGPRAVGESIDLFQISNDGMQVVYTTRQGTDTLTYDLYSVPIVGGTAVKLDTPDVNVQGSVLLSPDSRRVVYWATELFGTDLRNGGLAVQLSDPVTRNGSITSAVTFTLNGKQVVYGAQGSDTNTYEVFATPATGGATQKLSGSLAVQALYPMKAVEDMFTVTPDSRAVLFRDGANDLYISDLPTVTFTSFLPLTTR